MFLHSLTEKIFTDGLKIYLTEASLNPLGVTVPKHFYDAWQRAAIVSGDDNDDTWRNYKVEELFGSWERAKGYPILNVERSFNNHRVRFTQVRKMR